MKSYLEIKVPITYNDPLLSELSVALQDIPVHWQKGFFHITMAFIDDTQNLHDLEAIMHKHLDEATPVTIAFDKLDVFSTGAGMIIVHLTTNNIPNDFRTLVEDIRCDVNCTNSRIQSDFRLHVTLGRITAPEADVEDIGFLLDEIVFSPLTLTLNEVEYREFRGRTIYKNTLK
jgi:2'-5' RNA ligase